jgi:hypothetical protein
MKPVIPDDVDLDLLVSRLAGPLPLAARRAFRAAAAEALARIPCLGEGAAYRALIPVQRAFFDPPSDCRAGWDIADERLRPSGRASRLIAGPAIQHDSARQQRARRSRFFRVAG